MEKVLEAARALVAKWGETTAVQAEVEALKAALDAHDAPPAS